MTTPPAFLEAADYTGKDTAERWKNYIEGLYVVYLRTVAHGGLTFRGLPVRCQFRPETLGKHYAFWHMMQEGFREEDRTIDVERCRRVAWISWVIQNAPTETGIRVFPQKRPGEKSWVLWLYEHDYAVILWERNDYFLLKTAFMVKPHKRTELERDWKASGNTQ
jgi:hypothetical protein